MKNKHNNSLCKYIYIFIYFFMTLYCGSAILYIQNDFIRVNNVFIVYAILVLFVAVFFLKELILGFKRIKIKQLDWLCGIGIIVIVLEVLVNICLANILNLSNQNQVSIESQKIISNSFLLYLTVIILAPIAEEFTYRFCLISLASEKKYLHAILSVIMFSFMHVMEYIGGDSKQLLFVIPYIVMGIGLAITYIHTKNICYSILLHSFVNILSILA